MSTAENSPTPGPLDGRERAELERLREADRRRAEEQPTQPSRLANYRAQGMKKIGNVALSATKVALGLVIGLILIAVILTQGIHNQLGSLFVGAVFLGLAIGAFWVCRIAWGWLDAALGTAGCLLALLIADSSSIHGQFGYGSTSFNWAIQGPRYLLYGAIAALIGMVVWSLADPGERLLSYSWFSRWMVSVVLSIPLFFSASDEEFGADWDVYVLTMTIIVLLAAYFIGRRQAKKIAASSTTTTQAGAEEHTDADPAPAHG